MKYFKDSANVVYAFESDGSQDEFIPEGLTPITDAEADELRRPVLSDTELAAIVRADRDARLLASDWSQLRDVPDVTAAAWAPYRQALRDLTSQPGFPRTVTWPVAPV